MWRLGAVAIVLASCGRAPKGHGLALVVGDAARLSSGTEVVDVAMTPALAADARGLLVAWSVVRRTEADVGRVLVRRGSFEGAPVGDALELGRGLAPSIAIDADRNLVAWRHPVDAADPVVAIAAVARDGSASPPVLARDMALSGAPTLGAISAGEVVAVACSVDQQRLLVLREPFDGPVGQHATRDGCDGVVLAGAHRTVALIHATEAARTEVVEFDGAATRSVASVGAPCAGALTIEGETKLVCLERPFGTELQLRSGPAGDEPFATATPLDLASAGAIFEYHAVAVDRGMLVAWTVETPDGFRLSAAVIDGHGRTLVTAIGVSPSPAVPRFDLVGYGDDAWLAFVTERQVSDTVYRHDVVVIRIRITGT